VSALPDFELSAHRFCLSDAVTFYSFSDYAPAGDCCRLLLPPVKEFVHAGSEQEMRHIPNTAGLSIALTVQNTQTESRENDAGNIQTDNTEGKMLTWA
jgi:hypothetical protein